MNPNLIGKRPDRAKARYFTVLKYQLTILLVFSALTLYVDLISAYSALIGGVIYLAPTAYFAFRHFNVVSGNSAHAALAELIARQIWKMLLMVALFALVFVIVEPLSAFFLFASLFVMQLSHLVLHTVVT